MYRNIHRDALSMYAVSEYALSVYVLRVYALRVYALRVYAADPEARRTLNWRVRLINTASYLRQQAAYSILWVTSDGAMWCFGYCHCSTVVCDFLLCHILMRAQGKAYGEPQALLATPLSTVFSYLLSELHVLQCPHKGPKCQGIIAT